MPKQDCRAGSGPVPSMNAYPTYPTLLLACFEGLKSPDESRIVTFDTGVADCWYLFPRWHHIFFHAM